VIPAAPLSAALALGFLLGVRHALDADHLAAVAALASGERRLGRSMLLGTFWGAGHTTALLAAAVVVNIFRIAISPEIEGALEKGVAVMLMILGAHVLLRAVSGVRMHGHTHGHDGVAHAHVHLHGASDDSHTHHHLLRLGRRPFLVGLVHGLAGSAALMLLALAAMPSPVAAVLYVALFGLGSTAGMLVISGLVGLPFALAARRAGVAELALRVLAGAASVVLGAVLLHA
jgi:high-affinity nickel permease